MLTQTYNNGTVDSHLGKGEQVQSPLDRAFKQGTREGDGTQQPTRGE